MKTLEYNIRFITPAFLGNAEQNGQWRTPPFKALLRQWWRVAVAKEFNYNVECIRRKEGELFGEAADGYDSRKSSVRIRLDKWCQGTLNSAPKIGQINVGKNSIPAELYSGYGPVEKGPKLKANAALQAGDSTIFRIAFPEGEGIEKSLSLMHHYGTVGGRSRNGWGSFFLAEETNEFDIPLLDWREALVRDWSAAIGKDDIGPLIWQLDPSANWESVMGNLAQIRANLRRAVPDRLLLAYPDTKSQMAGWSKNDRVPNSIRFKVRVCDSKYIGVIYHVPCRPKDDLWHKLNSKKQDELHSTFATAHSFLDSLHSTIRIGS